tara:strand:- start:2 stop:703 length:702 start_codon:yes stop_codon:yes gene_type:complete
VKDFDVDIYLDGPKLEELSTTYNVNVAGYTFNPSLFRSNNAENYIDHSKKILTHIQDKPVSLEVIADSFDEMISQAVTLNALAENVFVKIPITNTKAELTLPVLKELVKKNIKMNITAIFTFKQVEEILNEIKNTNSIISVFSGRLFDIGIDAVPITKEISSFVHNNSQCKTLWASTRMVYDINNAMKSDCDIITMPTSFLKKIHLFEKNPENYSLETVKMFYEDALKSNYKI